MAKPANGAPRAEQKERVRLTHQHSFIDEDNRHRVWKGGDVISDPAEIALLRQRGARLEQVDPPPAPAEQA